MKLWIQTLMIWGGFLCFAWGSYESNNNQLLQMRGKAFVHTVELLQQVKTKPPEPPSNNAPAKTVSLRLPDHAALPITSYNIHGPESATGEIARCCAVVFREPEKAKIPEGTLLTCRVGGIVESGASPPLTVKYPRQELLPDLPAGMTLAFRKTEIDARQPTPVILSALHGISIRSADIIHASAFDVRMTMANVPRLAYPGLKEIAITAKPGTPADNIRPPIRVAYVNDLYGVKLTDRVQTAPLSINVISVLLAWTSNSLAPIPSLPAIKFNAVAFQDKGASINPVLASYHPVNIPGYIQPPYNISYTMYGTTPAVGSTTHGYVLGFKEPEKAILSSETFLTCRTEGMAGTGYAPPLIIKGLLNELASSLPSITTVALRKTGTDTFISAPTISLTCNLGSSVNLANPVSASNFEVRSNLTGPQLPDVKEMKIAAAAILPRDDVRLPINLALNQDQPLSINAGYILKAAAYSTAYIPSIPAIEFKAIAFQDREWTANPILVSYHPENMPDSISSPNNASSGIQLRRTSSDANLPELNEIVLAVNPIGSGSNASTPIEIISIDSIAGGIASNFHIAPINLNTKSVLDALANSALISTPDAPKLNFAALDGLSSSANPIFIPHYAEDTFALNKAHVDPILLNGPQTNTFLSVQIRQIVCASNLAVSSPRNPCNLTVLQPDITITQVIDRMLISGIIDDVQSGRINKRNPEIRMQLVKYLGDNPFGPTSRQVFSMILDNFPGNALRRKIAALQTWSKEYANGRYAPILGYHIMNQFYRSKDYDAAIQFADSVLANTNEFNDRVCFLQALCFAQKNNTTAAQKVLQKIKSDYPDSSMAPEAVFLSAWIFYEDGKLAEARTILNELVAKYPKSASAVKAGNLLEAIKQNNSLAALKP